MTVQEVSASGGLHGRLKDWANLTGVGAILAAFAVLLVFNLYTVPKMQTDAFTQINLMQSVNEKRHQDLLDQIKTLAHQAAMNSLAIEHSQKTILNNQKVIEEMLRELKRLKDGLDAHKFPGDK